MIANLDINLKIILYFLLIIEITLDTTNFVVSLYNLVNMVTNYILSLIFGCYL